MPNIFVSTKCDVRKLHSADFMENNSLSFSLGRFLCSFQLSDDFHSYHSVFAESEYLCSKRYKFSAIVDMLLSDLTAIVCVPFSFHVYWSALLFSESENILLRSLNGPECIRYPMNHTDNFNLLLFFLLPMWWTWIHSTRTQYSRTKWNATKLTNSGICWIHLQDKFDLLTSRYFPLISIDIRKQQFSMRLSAVT